MEIKKFTIGFPNEKKEKNINFVGRSPVISRLLEFIEKASITDENILLLGETGVGKELAARWIHLCNERKFEPFVKINCSNLNENLLESELFGYKKGAFTGAVIDKPGLIEEAQNGTFFLDEIADIIPYLQAKLLSIIEEKELRRLGENKIRKVNVRFILATNKNLHELVSKGKFRRDLYYRISILKYTINPLRDRKEDIPLLIENILNKFQHVSRKKILSREALIKLRNHSYPGNVRELENIIKRAYVLSEKNEIREKDIEFDDEGNGDPHTIPEKLFEKMLREKEDFWEVVHKPFLQRELNRKEVRKIIALGFNQTKGSYKRLLPLFNLEQTEKNYKRFMKILRIHKLST